MKGGHHLEEEEKKERKEREKFNVGEMFYYFLSLGLLMVCNILNIIRAESLTMT
jgi:hypothetical protein